MLLIKANEVPSSSRFKMEEVIKISGKWKREFGFWIKGSSISLFHGK